MIRQLMKTYLHKPVKILQILTLGRIQNFDLTSKLFLAFLTIEHLQAESLIYIRDFLTCYSCSYYSSILLHVVSVNHGPHLIEL